MLIRIFIFTALLLLGQSVVAQDLYLTLSQGSGRIKYSPNFNFKDEFDVQAIGAQHQSALDFEWFIRRRWGIHCGLTYNQRNTLSTFESGDRYWGVVVNTVTYRGNHLQMPISVVYKMRPDKILQPFARLGFINALVLNEYRVEYGTLVHFADITKDREGDFGLMTGLGALLQQGDWALKTEMRMIGSVREIPTAYYYQWLEGTLPTVLNDFLPTRSWALLVGVQHRF